MVCATHGAATRCAAANADDLSQQAEQHLQRQDQSCTCERGSMRQPAAAVDSQEQSACSSSPPQRCYTSLRPDTTSCVSPASIASCTKQFCGCRCYCCSVASWAMATCCSATPPQWWRGCRARRWWQVGGQACYHSGSSSSSIKKSIGVAAHFCTPSPGRDQQRCHMCSMLQRLQAAA
jgi:hypothetical protein